MTTLLMIKDLAGAYKRETILNAGILSKLQPMVPELSRLIFKENALEKPTQNLFNNLTYYLVSIIDTQVCSSFTWPLYDTKAERMYRSELSNFINSLSGKGLVSSILSSYLVNPGSYKVTVLLYQLSQLAVKHFVQVKVAKKTQSQLYNEMTEKYKSQKDNNFVECINKETERMLNNFSNYLHKRKAVEKIAAIFRKKITDMESKLAVLNCQNYINELVDTYIEENNLDENAKTEMAKIKNVNEQPLFFDNWLQSLDKHIEAIENDWNSKATPFLQLCNTTYENTENLIKVHTGQAEKSSYLIEYDPQSDTICTEKLEVQVNSQQKFILKNLDIKGRLNFPNLIRAYIISISFIFKNIEVGEDIVKFNEQLDGAKEKFKDVVLGLSSLLDRITNAESKLQPEAIISNETKANKNFPYIPPVPNFSDLILEASQNNIINETYTPLNTTKHEINLLKRTNVGTTQQQIRMAPFCQAPKDDFIKSLISCRVSSYDHTNIIEDSHHQTTTVLHKGNETIAECSVGFTKQQILRLLSTKKNSGSKKLKSRKERTETKQKGGLFNESIYSNESSGLFRSYSSPNLYENRERRHFNIQKGRKLSVMQEDSQFNVSGITCLDTDSNFNTPQGFGIAESSRKEIDTSILPTISVTNEAEERINDVLNNMKDELENDLISPILEVSKKSIDQYMGSLKVETPQSNSQPVKKVSSLEKLINRFKKVRANVVSEHSQIKTITEEKENVTSTNRILLPDLLSPSCSTDNIKTNANTNFMDQLYLDIEKKESRRPRESLGTALGVDQTFLDQFDLID